MSSKRSKPLSLHEILNELENSYDPASKCITFEPPNNANAAVTDEDSGEKDNVTIHNLSGFILPAEANYSFWSRSESKRDDDILLSSVQKKSRIEQLVQQTRPSTSSVLEYTLIPTFVQNNTYQWRNQHIK